MVPVTEEEKIDATQRLAMNRAVAPELAKAEAQARLSLAAAIIALDEVEERIHINGEPIHSLIEQARVEQAKDEYAQALANLVRRKTPPAEV